MSAVKLIDALIADQRQDPHHRHIVDDLEHVLRRIAREAVYYDAKQAFEALADQCAEAVKEMPDD